MTYAADNPTAAALTRQGRPSSSLRVPTPLLGLEDQELIVKAAAATGRPISAAEELGFSPRSYQLTKEHDPEFALAIEAAIARHVERLEQAADTRAVDGWLEPVFFEGEQCGTIRKFSDGLLTTRLKALAPHRYRENISVESKVAAGVLVVPATGASAAEWAAAFGGQVATGVPAAATGSQSAGDGKEG